VAKIIARQKAHCSLNLAKPDPAQNVLPGKVHPAVAAMLCSPLKPKKAPTIDSPPSPLASLPQAAQAAQAAQLAQPLQTLKAPQAAQTPQGECPFSGLTLHFGAYDLKLALSKAQQ
jgi:hypothetical protein